MQNSADFAIGKFFKEMRLKVGISQWEFCRKLDYHIRNIQRIEAGLQDPQLDSALKMIATLGFDCGSFLAEFADMVGLQGKNQGKIPQNWSENATSDASPTTAGYYGHKLRLVRGCFKMSQAALSERAHYCLRSINKLETGKQMPRITGALKLVVATGCDVGWFFGEFQRF